MATYEAGATGHRNRAAGPIAARVSAIESDYGLPLLLHGIDQIVINKFGPVRPQSRQFRRNLY